MSSSVLSASLTDRRAAVGRSRFRTTVVAISYAVLIVAVAVEMFSGINNLSGMLAVAAVWLGALYAVTCWWLRHDGDSRTGR
ncbi:hypothetical protein HQ325_16930 [Rhodococcus sp. BP-349]|uniref:hypothetical protein n=1 Tax=unclassified Rhodococcus (in: high G+C Gram-positive bacteria) TaxID=192944 RepID=UPI001C9AB486|nr:MULTISPECIES: hypothetical protein [unclassified Rhodococcus (in: high G+C Gram-positive bacteria)]MBY6540361.1 hypothetical protein [Rhodococcus sp. BP-363]MBY6545614.1 hypothetical protein [Rhodococcus sp. BP-369]MBY6564844.1 hypothetical protein [Rhodococcus sp. BP-370]MBY6578220.1 hypothetical protein [Rhodococcus sp. BP-364]MBY6587521.1 hypothetical protein [Rhodococcus sp. BP-358]